MSSAATARVLDLPRAKPKAKRELSPPPRIPRGEVVQLLSNPYWKWDPNPRKKGWYAILQMVSGTSIPGVAYWTGTSWRQRQDAGLIEASYGPFATAYKAKCSIPGDFE